tara:strand:+ start:1068 stop:2237 length:1170 start_codon:yes stop_codon:yes gene_type:complete
MLDGIKVLDFSRYIAGPYCGALLAGLGAEVIRVERPEGGEDRFVGPVGDQLSSLFLKTGCAKKSITLNFRHENAKEVVGRLVGNADVVIANMPPKVLKGNGLDYETLKALNPRIILTTQTCFGHEGPLADRGGFDGIGQVMSGAAFMSGTPGQPRRAAAPYVDFATAALGAFGTLAAIIQRQSSSEGQHVQVSLLGSAFAIFAGALIEENLLKINRKPSGNRGQTAAPVDIIKAKDGEFIIQVVGNGLFKRLVTAIGKDDWIGRADLKTDELRGNSRDEVCAAVASWASKQTVRDAIAKLAAAGVPCGPVLRPEEAFDHEQVQAMKLKREFEFPGFDNLVSTVRMPIDFSGFSPTEGRPPLIGEHTDEVLSNAGFSIEEINVLREDSVI